MTNPKDSGLKERKKITLDLDFVVSTWCKITCEMSQNA